MKIFCLNGTSQEQIAAFESFVQSQHGDVQQSYYWGEFQGKIPYRGKFWALAAKEGDDLKATVVIVRQKLPLGMCWLYVARGPVFRTSLSTEEKQQTWSKLRVKIDEMARQEKAVFLRVEGQDFDLKLDGKGWRDAYAHYQPEWSLKVDLNQTEEEILAQMKSKGRYNIKVAQKHGVVIRMTTKSEDVAAFYEVLQKTGGRDGFGIHPESYYQTMIDSLKTHEMGALFVAEQESQTIGGLVATFYGKTATYYYGASDHAHRKMMAPYLTQWEAMLEGKKRGCTEYDFLGIAPPDQPDHPWAGITDFKRKFGGETIEYSKARDLVYRGLWYGLIKLRRKLKG